MSEPQTSPAFAVDQSDDAGTFVPVGGAPLDGLPPLFDAAPLVPRDGENGAVPQPAAVMAAEAPAEQDDDDEGVEERGLPVGQVAAGGASVFSIIGVVLYQTVGGIGLAAGGLVTVVAAVGYVQHRRGGTTGPSRRRGERTGTTGRTTSGTGGGSLLGGGSGGGRRSAGRRGGGGSLLPSLGLPKGGSGRSTRRGAGTGTGGGTGSSRTAGRRTAAAGTGGGGGGVSLPLFRKKGTTGTSSAGGGARAASRRTGGGRSAGGSGHGTGTGTGAGGSSTGTGSGAGTSRRRLSWARGRMAAARHRAASGARAWNAGVNGGGRVLATRWAARHRRVKALDWRRATWSARGRRVRAFDWRFGAWRGRWTRLWAFDWKTVDWKSVFLNPAAPDPAARPDAGTTGTEPTPETAAAGATSKDTSPGPRRPVRAGQQRDDAATRPVTTYGRTPTAMSGNPLVIGAAEVANAATTYAPEDMWVVDKDLQILPEMSISIATAVRNLHHRLDAEYPIHPSVTEILMQLHDAIAATAGIADQLSQQFQAVHADDIARRLAPRTNEQMWNV